MKKNLISALAVILVICMLAAPASAAGKNAAELTVNGEYSVIINDENMRTAAEYFTEYIEGAAGFKPAITTEKNVFPAIVLSTGTDKIKEGCVISEKDGNIYITGADLTQTVRGMYAFLYRYAGVRIYSGEEAVYTKNAITVPRGEKYEYVLPFRYTETDWYSPKFTQYSLFNALTGTVYRGIPDELGGGGKYLSRFCHTLTTEFCSADKYYGEHPEYFAFHRWHRTKKQLCLSNPDTLEIVKSEVFGLLENGYNPEGPAQIISLTQHDNTAFCTCKKCRETDKKYGSHAGTMLEFVNEIARAVSEAGYDNVIFDTFAYRYTRKPPEGIVPEKNVTIRMGSIECCFAHALDDESCEANAEFAKDLEGWSEICDNICIWDYCTDFSDYMGIFPDFGVLQRNMQFFAEHNVRDIYEEGNYSLETPCEFSELRSYMICALFADPYCDLSAVTEEFCDYYYGDGGKYIKEFVDFISENESSLHLSIYQSMNDVLELTDEEVDRCDELWQKAVQNAAGDELEHVRISELAWRRWKMKNHAGEFGSFFKYFGERRAFKKELKAADLGWTGEIPEPFASLLGFYEKFFLNHFGFFNSVMQWKFRL